MSVRSRSPADLALIGLVAAMLLMVVVSFQAPRAMSLDDRARSLAGELRCPVCQGLSIADSPAPLAAQMRRIVREQLAAGATDQEVRDFFVARYGSWILLAPPARGIELLLWLAPGGFVLLGLVALTMRSRHRARRGPATRPHRLGRLASVGLGLAVAAGLGVPLVLAVGARSGGQEITGFFPGARSPSLAELAARVAAQPQDVDALLGLADGYVNRGRLNDATALYRRVLDVDATNVRALVGLGVILVLADRPDGAVLAFDRALAVSPDDPDALIYRALARARLEGPGTPAVRVDAERFLAVAPGDPRVDMARQLMRPPPSAAP